MCSSWISIHVVYMQTGGSNTIERSAFGFLFNRKISLLRKKTEKWINHRRETKAAAKEKKRARENLRSTSRSHCPNRTLPSCRKSIIVRRNRCQISLRYINTPLVRVVVKDHSLFAIAISNEFENRLYVEGLSSSSMAARTPSSVFWKIHIRVLFLPPLHR